MNNESLFNCDDAIAELLGMKVRCDKVYIGKSQSSILATTSQSNFCNNCEKNSLVTDNDTGNMLCDICGIIVRTHVFTRLTESKFNADGIDNNSRCSIVTNPYMKSASYGMTIGSNRTRQTKRLSTLKKWDSVTHIDRKMNDDLTMIFKILTKHDINEKIINTCQKNFFYVINGSPKRSSNRIGLMAASLYYASKYHSPKTNLDIKNKNIFFIAIDELVVMFKITNKILSNGLKIFMTTFYATQPKLIGQLAPTMPNEFVYKYVFALNLSKHLNHFIRTLKWITFYGLHFTFRPKSIAIGCIYLTIIERLSKYYDTQDKQCEDKKREDKVVTVNIHAICNRCDNISHTTLKSIYKVLKKYRNTM
jgi:transcription initiation factor TFIIIB Brf1 subunit/transcription initiation factor TFIIB